MTRQTAVGWVVGLVVSFGASVARGDGAVDPAEVDAAIARGVAFLKEEQGPRGEWSYSFNHNHALGITALAGLALLENGVEPDDRAVGKAAEAVRDLARRSNQTYDLTLAILFLARIQKGSTGPNDDLIRRLAGRLAGGENGGQWSYTVPQGDGEGSARRRPAFGSGRGAGDNSNTQFGLLGMWAAGRHGFDANGPLAAVESHFRGSVDRDGRWGYTPGDPGGEAMTCAGLMGLAISAARPERAERQTARARGAALAADPVFVEALQAVGRDARGIGGRSDVYYLWSLERVCVALGLRDLDGFDWYAAGARELLRRQRPDGGWPQEHWGTLPNTCLALLFLRKANLAFELDRVLKLPGATRPKAAGGDEPAAPDPAPSAAPAGEVAVVVTGASDAQFPKIALDFEVKRPDGSFLVDATRDDFKVTEDGAEVEVLRLDAPTARVALPTTVVLVVDRSRSMEEEDRIGGLKRAVATFLGGLPKGSRVAVVAFGSEVEQACPFTEDLGRARAAVDRLTPAGATRYYDAVADSIALLQREPGRRAVLALTDGEDTFSQHATLDTVIASARKAGLPVHTLGLGGEDEIESAALRRLASATRGQYYSARRADQLRTIYLEIAERLRSTYTLVYRTDRTIPDGTLRPVRVSYRASRKAGETAVFIPGMVVPAAGWPRLFLALVAGLFFLAALPGRRARRAG